MLEYVKSCEQMLSMCLFWELSILTTCWVRHFTAKADVFLSMTETLAHGDRWGYGSSLHRGLYSGQVGCRRLLQANDDLHRESTRHENKTDSQMKDVSAYTSANKLKLQRHAVKKATTQINFFTLHAEDGSRHGLCTREITCSTAFTSCDYIQHHYFAGYTFCLNICCASCYCIDWVNIWTNYYYLTWPTVLFVLFLGGGLRCNYDNCC